MKIGFDDFLVKHGQEKFNELLRKAKPTLDLHVEEGTSADLILSELTQLDNDILRAKILKSIAKRERVDIDAVRAEYQKLIPKKEETEEEKEETFTPEEMEKAIELLNSPDILEKMIELTTSRGYVGEAINKRMLYLLFTSRLLRNSISAIVKGASGKSALVRTILSLYPKADIFSYSLLTAKALFYFNRDLSHKILFIQEHQGSQKADYSIRTTLSENEISIALPVKVEGTSNFTTTEKRVPAVGLVFVETTTSERVHVENQTRVFDLHMDESKEQTEKVLYAESERGDGLKPELESEIRIWRAAQTLITNYEVCIPYSIKLVEAFPKDSVRVRRDFPRFLSLIRTHTLLYQYQRQKDSQGRLIATAEDLKAILSIAEVVLVQSHKEISPNLEKVVQVIEANFGENHEFSFGDLEKRSEYKGKTLRRYLGTLMELDFVSHNGLTGKDSHYTLLSSLSSMSDFRSKVLRILEEIEDKPKSTHMTSMSSNDGKGATIEDNEDNRGQQGLSSTKPNDNSVLHQENPFEDIGTGDHSKCCDCWEWFLEPDYSSGIGKTDPGVTRSISKRDNEACEVTLERGNGKCNVSMVTREIPEFEIIQRDHESITASDGIGMGGIDSDTGCNLSQVNTDTGISVSQDTEGLRKERMPTQKPEHDGNQSKNLDSESLIYPDISVDRTPQDQEFGSEPTRADEFAEHQTTQANGCDLTSTYINPEQTVEPSMSEDRPFELTASPEISEAHRTPTEEDLQLLERGADLELQQDYIANQEDEENQSEKEKLTLRDAIRICQSETTNSKMGLRIYVEIIELTIWLCIDKEQAAQVEQCDPEAICYTVAEIEQILSRNYELKDLYIYIR